jgi:hypothetical protein
MGKPQASRSCFLRRVARQERTLKKKVRVLSSTRLSQEGKEPRFSPNLIRNCLRIQTA